jgi:hypothetical protein
MMLGPSLLLKRLQPRVGLAIRGSGGSRSNQQLVLSFRPFFGTSNYKRAVIPAAKSLSSSISGSSVSSVSTVTSAVRSRIQSLTRRFSSTDTNVLITKESEQILSRPPLAIRAAIVGSSVGLATPLFALGGVARLWFSYLPRTENGRIAKNVIGILLGVGSTGLFYNYVIPFLRYNSDFMLPFAMSNALMATAWYTAAELWLGLDVMLLGVSEQALIARNVSPAVAAFLVRLIGASAVAGAAVGALTAITAPYCWPFFFSICWDRDLKTLLMKDDPYWIIDLYNWIAIPVGVPVGILAGITLQSVLKSYIVGVPSVPWSNRSLPLLVGILGLSGVYYTFFRSFSTDFLWEKRLDHETGQVISYNPRTGQLEHDNGEQAFFAQMKREVIKRINSFRNLFRFFGDRKDEKPRSLSPKDDITVSVLDDRAALFSIVDQLVRLKFLYLQKKKQAKLKAAVSPKAMTAEQKAFMKTDFDAMIKGMVTEFDILNKGNQSVNLLTLLDLVEKGIVSKRVEDRFERNEEYRGADHMYADCVRRIEKMGDCTLNESVRNSLAMLAVNLDMASNEFKSKLGFEILEGSEEEKAIITEYRNSGTVEVVTRTIKLFLLAGAVGSGCTALAMFLLGSRNQA